ncbi:MAG: hypothetical protein ABEI11_04570 [Haloarculaceae archaeon]
MTRNRRGGAAVAVAVALVVVLAGCSALPGAGPEPDAAATAGAGDGDRGNGTPTLTPVPVVTGEATAAAATPTPETLVAGLAPGGVRDPFTLATGHRDALADTSYRRIRTERIEGPNGTLWNETSRVRVNADRSRLLFEQDIESAPDYPVDAYRKNLAIYYDGNASYFRGFVDGELSYAKVSGNAGSVLSDVSERDRLMVLFERFQWKAERVPSGYRMTSSYLLDDTVLNAPPLVEEPENATMTVWLTDDGRVRFYRLAYNATLETPNRRVRFVRTVRFDRVGTATVPEPDWYPAAVNRTGAGSEIGP